MILQSDEPVIEEEDDDDDDEEDDDKDEDDAEGNWTFAELTLYKDFFVDSPLCIWLFIYRRFQIPSVHLVNSAIRLMQEQRIRSWINCLVQHFLHTDAILSGAVHIFVRVAVIII